MLPGPLDRPGLPGRSAGPRDVRSVTAVSIVREHRVVDPTVRLLGVPAIERGGQLVPSAVSRQHLAGLLFSEADDPLGALRWTLAELRRSLGVAGSLHGDPVTVGLDGASIDVVSLMGGDHDELLGLRGELLEGLHVEGCPAFESWLVVERYRVSAEIEARLRQAAMGLLVGGRAEQALAFASQADGRNLLDEGNHELLVRCLAAVGDDAGALRQVAVCEEVLGRELGVEASPVLRLPPAAPTDPGWSRSVGDPRS